MVKEIHLQNKMVAIVDEEDYERVKEHVWTVSKSSDTTFNITSVCGRKTLSLRRFILDVDDDTLVLHKNKNEFDCRKNNLLIGDCFLSSIMSKGRKGSSSKYKGVFWSKNRNKWVAQIRINGVRTHLGYFVDEDEAALVYNELALKHYGQYAYQNIIGENNNSVDIKKDKVQQIRRNKKNKTGFRHVTARPNGKFQAFISVNKKREFIGTFNTAEEAAKAYDRRAYELYGNQAIFNFPEEWLSAFENLEKK